MEHAICHVGLRAGAQMKRRGGKRGGIQWDKANIPYQERERKKRKSTEILTKKPDTQKGGGSERKGGSKKQERDFYTWDTLITGIL